VNVCVTDIKNSDEDIIFSIIDKMDSFPDVSTKSVRSVNGKINNDNRTVVFEKSMYITLYFTMEF
jgi:hypothetical protein